MEESPSQEQKRQATPRKSKAREKRQEDRTPRPPEAGKQEERKKKLQGEAQIEESRQEKEKKWNFYSKNNFKIQTCLFTKHESLQGDSPRVHPNILKCSLHSLVTKGIRLVGFATRAMVCESPTHYLIVSKLISDPWGGGRDL